MRLALFAITFMVVVLVGEFFAAKALNGQIGSAKLN